MNLSLIRSMTRSAVFELENGLCFRPAHPFVVTLNGKTVYEACNTNVFSLFSLLPGTEYTVGVQAEGETLSLTFVTEAESFFVDASRYGLVADGETDNTGKLQAALSTCPKGGTVYVPAGRYRTASLFLKSNTTLYLEKGAVLLGDNDRTHYPILPGVLPSENEVDEYYLTGWEGNPLNSFAGLLNITQVHDVVVTGEGTLDCDAQNGDWWVNPKVKRIAWRPRAVAMVDALIRYAQDVAEELLRPAGLPAALERGWNMLNAAERFYLKTAALEREGPQKLDIYTNMARALRVAGHERLMSAESRANNARLKLSDELGSGDRDPEDEWGGSPLRALLNAMRLLRQGEEAEQVLAALAEDCRGRYALLRETLAGMAEFLARARGGRADKGGFTPQKEAECARVLAEALRAHRA